MSWKSWAQANRGKLICGVVLFVGAIVCLCSTGPAYLGSLAATPSHMMDCGECASKYAEHVIKSANAQGIIDKIKKAHDEHHHEHHEHHHPDVCITDEDLDKLDLDNIDFPPFPEDCKKLCGPIAVRIPMAMAVVSVLTFTGAVLLVVSLVCCCLAMCCPKCCTSSPGQPQYTPVATTALPDRPTGSAMHAAASPYYDEMSARAPLIDANKV